MEEGERSMRLRKMIIAFLCASLLCSCGSARQTVVEKQIVYVTPKPFYLPPDEDNVYVLAAGMRKMCLDGTEYDRIKTAVKIIKRVKSDKYPDTLREVVGEIAEEPREADMEMAEEILIFDVEKSYKDNMTE